jgi:hypothetical protein
MASQVEAVVEKLAVVCVAETETQLVGLIKAPHRLYCQLVIILLRLGAAVVVLIAAKEL